MSDFFTDLATRSFAPANLLQPKLPSLFEAPSGGEPVLEESASVSAREEMAEVVPVSPIANRSRLEKYDMSEIDRSTPLQSEPSREASERQRVTRQTILPFTPEESPRAPIKIQGEEHVVAAATLRAETRFSERKQDTAPRLEAVTPLARKNDQAESDQGSASRFVPVIPKLEPHHPTSRAEKNMDAHTLLSENQSPTVHIRIGRIEVRAVTQPPPPARSVVPSRPKMTLDEYLLRRNEGKR